jgi:hypothetical protein
MAETQTNVDVVELLAIIGEQQVLARKREQRISELENALKAVNDARAAKVEKHGKLD